MENKNLILESEEKYLKSINKIMGWVLLLHIPFTCYLGHEYNTGLIFALIGSFIISSLPWFLTIFTSQYKLTSISYGIALIAFSALLIHLSKGMIEAHFHIFVSLATLILFANPWTIIAATITAALHHIGFYFLLPASVFNYKATFLVVVVHAFFVVLETIPCLWISIKFRRFVINQGVTVEQVTELSNLMHEMINKLNVNNAKLSESAEAQSSAVSQTDLSVTEINHVANQTATNAEDSMRNSLEGKIRANEGSVAADEMAHAIDNIKLSNTSVLNQMKASNLELSEIVNVIKQIENKAQVINEIVFQTKLLSFNASVEAARAGEHGKGFAVVAEEVGNLAQMSGNASKEITELIDRSVQTVEEISSKTESKIKELVLSSERSIQDGSKKVSLCKEKLVQIVTIVNDVDDKLNQIAKASKEQSSGINEINKVMSSLKTINKDNLNSIQVSANISKDLKHLSDQMSQMVEELSVTN